MIPPDFLDQFRVPGGKRVRLKEYPTGLPANKELAELGKEELKDRALEILEKNKEELDRTQELLYASDTWSVLIVFQAMDAAGKDGMIKHVMSGLNPQGCQVFSFKQPSSEELDHDFLWRYTKGLPERGRFGIFNRSHYEEVLVVKVHPEWLQKQKLPPGKRGKGFWNKRYQDINTFERHLVRSGTLILKFFLHISKEEQRRRFLQRLENPEKHWKFSTGDLVERGLWKEYQEAYQDALSATSTEWAPWYVIPADYKWVSRVLVADIITNAVQSLDLKYPEVSEEQKRQLEIAKAQLEAE